MSEAQDTSTVKIRFGLNAKVLSSAALLLLMVFSGYVYLNYSNLATFFDLERRTLFGYQYREFLSDIAHVEQQLELSSTNWLNRELTAYYSESDRQAMLYELRSLLQQTKRATALPIESLRVTVGNQPPINAGELTFSHAAERWLAGLDRKGGWFLDCRDRCYTLFAYRFTHQRQGQPLQSLWVYALETSRLMRNVIYDGETSTAFIAVGEDKRLRVLNSTPALGLNLDGLLSRLQALELQNGGVRNMQFSERHYEVNASVMHNSNQSGITYAVFVNDIDLLSQLLNRALFNSIGYGIGSALMAVVLLMYLLHRPLRRIRQVINLLPLLPASRHEEFRRELASQDIDRWPDEADALRCASLNLSDQLEALEQALHERADELSWLANHDPLTSLSNRRHFHERLSDALAANERGALMFIDLDNFKYVNDISGHNSGDVMLKQVSQTLVRLLPDKALLARISGDEFAAFLLDADDEMAEAVAQRMLAMFSQICIAGRERIHTASASIGIVMAPEHGVAVPELMAKADIAMYLAKERGKNTLAFFHPDFERSRINTDWYWLEKAQRAVDDGLLTLYFQPIMDNKRQQISHHEVLMRVRDEHGQLHSPYQLILAAEKNGYISQLDLWVLRAALDQWEQNKAFGIDCCFAINLSAKSFCDSKVIERIAQEFRFRGIHGSAVIFEITETAALPNMDQAREHIHRLQQLGCRIALDDFGVGYSSFHSLKSLPLDFIKIDGSFIREINQREDDHIFIRALVGIAHNFGHKTVAEFVENEEIQAILLTLGIDYSQGYHIGKPASARDIWSAP